MGFHVLSCIKDYWFIDTDLGVPHVAKIMSFKRFEEIRADIHFNNNNLMLAPSDLLTHNRAFKVKPVIEHF